MPKETFSGDDDKGGVLPPPKKKLVLDKFGLSPDVNIRDVFWKIMASYAATKKPGIDLTKLKHEVYALIRIALSAISNPKSESYGLSPKFIAYYTIMMIIDGNWNDNFVEFLSLSSDQKTAAKKDIIFALKKLMGQEKYREAITNALGSALRGKGSSSVALEYIAKLKSEQIVNTLKKELIIMARGDIGENQLNAIDAIAMIKSDEDVKKAFITLLSHWDVETRRAIVEILKTVKDEDVKAAAEKRLPVENDERIRAVLAKLGK
ncbi:MAG: HEAT repeat domain-containing protein [Candidatus Micrarchaeota archaeon]